MLTPSSITAVVLLFAFRFERLQVLDDAATLDAALLEVMVEHVPHQALRLRSRLGIDVAAVGQRQQRCAAYLRQSHARGGRCELRAAIEDVMVPCGRIDRSAGIRLAQQRQRVTELREQSQLEAAQYRR